MLVRVFWISWPASVDIMRFVSFSYIRPVPSFSAFDALDGFLSSCFSFCCSVSCLMLLADGKICDVRSSPGSTTVGWASVHNLFFMMMDCTYLPTDVCLRSCAYVQNSIALLTITDHIDTLCSEMEMIARQ